MSLFRELKRRNVIRVAVLYLAAAWLILQITDVLSSLLPVPESAGALVVMLLALGFIPTLILAWLYELTPDGIRREADVDRSQIASRKTTLKLDIVIVILLVVAIGGLLVDRLVPESSQSELETAEATDTTPPDPAFDLPDTPSIAVLPFDNLSADPEQAYFAAGMTEDIITKLTHVRGIRVISRNSTARYENTDMDLRQIGAELRVRHLLGGSVRTSGDRVRITAYLTDSTNLEEVWREQWDRSIDDFFSLEDEIAANIINELEIELVEGEQRRLEQQSTRNPNAYIAVRRGIVAFETLPKTRESLAKAREWFASAIELDSQYAAAYAWMALSHAEEATHGISLDRDASLSHAESWVQRALALDDGLSRAYDTLGWISILRGDIEQAYEFQRKALELAPGNADVLILIGDTLTALGRADEALTHVRKGMDLNPFPPWWYWWGLGQAHMHLENYDEALAATQKSYALYPDYEHTRLLLIIQLMGLGREDEARAHANELLRVNPDYDVNSIRYLAQMKNEALKERFIVFLRGAGIG